jgi:butyrate kinase
MVYQVSKEIGAQTTVLEGNLDAIVLTGGLAYSDYFVNSITPRIRHLGKIVRYPGEEELEALAKGALRVLKKEEQALVYPQLGEGPPTWFIKQ